MSIEYKLREADGEVEQCDSCTSRVPTAEFDWAPGTQRRDEPKRLLCEFCSTTQASRYTEYQTSDPQNWLRAEVWRAAACVFNMLKHGQDQTKGVGIAAPALKG